MGAIVNTGSLPWVLTRGGEPVRFDKAAYNAGYLPLAP